MNESSFTIDKLQLQLRESELEMLEMGQRTARMQEQLKQLRAQVEEAPQLNIENNCKQQEAIQSHRQQHDPVTVSIAISYEHEGSATAQLQILE